MTRQAPRFLMPLSKVASSIRRRCDRGCAHDDRKDQWWEARVEQKGGMKGWWVDWGVLGEQAGRGVEYVAVMRRPTFYSWRPGKRWAYWGRGREQKNNPLAQFLINRPPSYIRPSSEAQLPGHFIFQLLSSIVYKTVGDKVVLHCLSLTDSHFAILRISIFTQQV